MEAKVKRALVFGSVPCGDWSFLEEYRRPDQQVYCADGGLNNALAAGCKPNFVVGDWDSGGAPYTGVPSVTLPVEKDCTTPFPPDARSSSCADVWGGAVWTTRHLTWCCWSG